MHPAPLYFNLQYAVIDKLTDHKLICDQDPFAFRAQVSSSASSLAKHETPYVRLGALLRNSMITTNIVVGLSDGAD